MHPTALAESAIHAQVSPHTIDREAEQPLPLTHSRAVPVSIAPGKCLPELCFTGSRRHAHMCDVAVKLDLKTLLADSCGCTRSMSSTQQTGGSQKYKLISIPRSASHAQVAA